MSFGQQEASAGYGTEPKRMRLSGAAHAAAVAAGSSTTTRASTGAPTAMTNKGFVYRAQRGRGETAERRGVKQGGWLVAQKGTLCLGRGCAVSFCLSALSLLQAIERTGKFCWIISRSPEYDKIC